MRESGRDPEQRESERRERVRKIQRGRERHRERREKRRGARKCGSMIGASILAKTHKLVSCPAQDACDMGPGVPPSPKVLPALLVNALCVQALIARWLLQCSRTYVDNML